ncbi:hypothetical protein [Acetobacter pasteurianus]|uniref:hypothetical protein n=1 Tax=Acetobacter pasteurianus TaxID=438 RepID=UPI000F54E6CD|nr:hypothetical protein [Acetobacter pasteurianus]
MLEIFDPPPLIGVFSQFSAIFCEFGATFAHIDRPFLISLIFFKKCIENLRVRLARLRRLSACKDLPTALSGGCRRYAFFA